MKPFGVRETVLSVASSSASITPEHRLTMIVGPLPARCRTSC